MKQSNEIRELVKFIVKEHKQNGSAITPDKVKVLWKIQQSEQLGLLPEGIEKEKIVIRGKAKTVREHILSSDPSTIKLIEGTLAKRVQNKILREGFGSNKDEKPKLTKEEQDAAIQSIKELNKFSESIYRSNGLQEISEKLEKIAEFASTYTVEQAGDWFDGITVSRHMKGMSENVKNFVKTASEVTRLQQRLESLYEDIGGTLNRYFEIDDVEDEKKIEENSLIEGNNTPQVGDIVTSKENIDHLNRKLSKPMILPWTIESIVGSKVKIVSAWTSNVINSTIKLSDINGKLYTLVKKDTPEYKNLLKK